MHNLPNLITSVRLVAALVLLCLCITGQSRHSFMLLFVIASVSDMLDGLIARRFGWCTDFGARLDSISDLALYLAVLVCLLVNLPSLLKPAIPILVAGGLIQCLHITLAKLRLGKYQSYHSDFSRLVAYGMFFGVVAFWVFRSTHVIPMLAVLWIACSIEGLMITWVLKEPRSNVATVFRAIELSRQTVVL